MTEKENQKQHTVLTLTEYMYHEPRNPYLQCTTINNFSSQTGWGTLVMCSFTKLSTSLVLVNVSISCKTATSKRVGARSFLPSTVSTLHGTQEAFNKHSWPQFPKTAPKCSRMLQQTQRDIRIFKVKFRGKYTCWIPHKSVQCQLRSFIVLYSFQWHH